MSVRDKDYSFFKKKIIGKSLMQLLGYEPIILQGEVVSFELKLSGWRPQ